MGRRKIRIHSDNLDSDLERWDAKCQFFGWICVILRAFRNGRGPGPGAPQFCGFLFIYAWPYTV